MQIGPVQLIAFEFERVDQFKGQILRELDALRGHGLIRIIDLSFVMKEGDGTVHALQISDLPGYEATEFGALLDQMLGLQAGSAEADGLPEAILSPEQGLGMSLEEIRVIAATLTPGTATALVLIEHAWAIGLGAAINAAGGRMVAQGFLTRDALLMVGRELDAIVEAEVAIERAAAIRGATMIETLATLAAAEEVQQEAMAEAITMVAGVEAFRTTIAAEAVRTLIVAGLLEESDALEAIEVLCDAELITETAFVEAAHAAEDAAAHLDALLGAPSH